MLNPSLSSDPLVRWLILACDNIQLNLELNEGITLRTTGLDPTELICMVITYWELYKKSEKDSIGL
jgi:hypothetical protein